MSRTEFFLLFYFVISRIFFINASAVFFDSPEYLERFSNPNYLQAIASGHLPFHAGYSIMFWPIFHLSMLLHLNPPSAVILGQIIFSALAILCFFRFLKKLSNQNVAFIATLVSTLTPLYWITNVTIMMDSVYVNFFLIALYFLAKDPSDSKHGKRLSKANIFAIFFCLGMSFLTHPVVLFWLPFLWYSAYLINHKQIKTIFLVTITTVCMFGLLNSYLISNNWSVPLRKGVSLYLTGKLGEHVDLSLDIHSLLVFLRNAFIPTFRNNTNIIAILSIFSLVYAWFKNKKFFLLAFLWICPFFIVNQWWDSLLFGRHALLAGFGFAFTTAYIVRKRKVFVLGVITYVLIVSVPALLLLKQPIPYLEEQKFIEKMPQGLLIDTHFSRPQIQSHYQGEIIFVNEPGWGKIGLSKKIDDYLENKKSVFITTQALSDPYGLFSGPYLHSLSLSYAKSFELEDIIPHYRLEEYRTIDRQANIILYTIITKKPSSYPPILNLWTNRHRLDYTDPLSQLWFLLTRH